MRITPFLALLLAACGSAEQKNDAITVTGGNASTGAPAQIAPAEAKGQEFVAAVLGGYDFALRSAELANTRAGRPEVKEAGRKLTTQLSASLDAMKAIANRANLKLEPTPGPTSATDLAVLGSAQGDGFDRAYAERQMENLTLLVGLLRAYKNGGDNAELRAWADQAQAVVNEHLLDTQTLNAVVEESAG